MQSITTADGTTIAFDDHPGGDATAVVLVHGITESASTWDPLIDRLTPSRRVVAIDLRGHGRSSHAEVYDLNTMVSDVGSVASELGLDRPHLVGHSLGGAVVSAAGAAIEVSSVVDVDQSLQLDAFKEQLGAFEDQLRDPDTFPAVIGAIFDSMSGDLLDPDEIARLQNLRRPDQTVVLGVWELILSSPTEEIAAVVEAALGGYAGVHAPYLALFGLDPGPGYGDWLSSHIDGAVTELWDGHGHYPHLVDPERFVARLDEFWSS